MCGWWTFDLESNSLNRLLYDSEEVGGMTVRLFGTDRHLPNH